MRVHIINEHPDWLAPLGRRLDRAGIPWTEWYTDQGAIDLDAAPPEGVFFNRMSASAHTRGHAHSANHARGLLAWLAAHGRRVLNGPDALALEMSKARQHLALRQAGIDTPRTTTVIGAADAVRTAARSLTFPLIIKPNRGGKGLGVRLAASFDQLDAYLSDPLFEPSPDGVHLLQEYIQPLEPVITRCEFVGGKFVYAISSSTAGGFELCPADSCAPCAVGGKFRLLEGFTDPVLERYARLTRACGLDVCGIEFVRDRDGRPFTYDINATTNYNAAIEDQAGDGAAGAALTALLERELAAARLPRANPAQTAAHC